MEEKKDRGADEAARNESASFSGPLSPAEQKISDILRSSPALLFTQDASLRYTWFFNPRNPGPGSASLFTGKVDGDLFTPERAERLTELKQKVLRTGRACRQEFAYESEEGFRHFELTLEPLRDDSGNISGISGMAMEIITATLARVGSTRTGPLESGETRDDTTTG